MVWVVSRFRLKAPPGISSSCISPLTSSGQRSRASWASQCQKSATLSPQPGGKPWKFIRTCGGIEGGRKKNSMISPPSRKSCRIWDNVKKYGRARQSADDITIGRMRIACWITKATDTHLLIFNTYCFSTARVVRRTRPNVTFVLSCLMLYSCGAWVE